MSSGKLYGVGVGPGDPELLTLKALRLIKSAPCIAYPAPENGESFARVIIDEFVSKFDAEQSEEICFKVPMSVERHPAQNVYDQAAADIAQRLRSGLDVVVLCEGDPFFYGSFMYLYQRLAPEFECEIVPGVTSLTSCAAALGRPLTARNDTLCIVPAPLDDDKLRDKIQSNDAVAIMKVGRHMARVKGLLSDMGLLEKAGYIERASLPIQALCKLADAPQKAPYFSMIIIYKGEEGWLSDWPAAPPIKLFADTKTNMQKDPI